MKKHVIEVLGYRFTMKVIEQRSTDVEHAISEEIQERWYREYGRRSALDGANKTAADL